MRWSYARALQIYPGLADAWAEKGVLLSEAELVEEAEECKARALEICPELADDWAAKAEEAFHAGWEEPVSPFQARDKEAVEAFDTAEFLGYEQAREHLERLRKGRS